MADLIRVCGSPNPPEGRLIPTSTSLGRLAGIGSLTGGFGFFDWRVLGRVLAGFETMTWEDENALGGSGFYPRDLRRATTRPPWRFRYTDIAAAHGWHPEPLRSIFAGTGEMV